MSGREMWAVTCAVILPYLFDDETVIAFCVLLVMVNGGIARMSWFAMHVMYWQDDLCCRAQAGLQILRYGCKSVEHT